MPARIYRPAKTAMQSGPAGNARMWVLEYEPVAPKRPDPLMGWLGSADTTQQICLKFATRDAAVGYAKRMGIDCQISDEPRKTIRPKNYADNFSFSKMEFGRF
ncbi:MAG: ETC complex I subunit [Magnetospirillum sp.]|nr:ETC complex I subunit [Magnetospirillum sp.]